MGEERISGRLRLVAVYQILGGLAGLLGAVQGNSRFTPPQAAAPEVTFSFVLRGGALALACLAAVSLISGSLLLKRGRHGILLSGLTQLLQLPMIMAQGLHYHLFLLLSVGLGLAPNQDLLLNYFYGSGSILCRGDCQAQFTGVNLIAGIMLMILALAAKEELAFVNRARATAAKPGAALTTPGIGVCRRGLAFIVDLTVATLVSLVVFALLGLLVPLDGEEAPLALYLAVTVFVVLMIATPYLFPNSLGKYLMKVRIQGVGADHTPTAGQYLVRGVLQFLWPVEAVVILFSRSKKRLGDRLAKTEVVSNDRCRRPWYVRSALAGATIVSLFFLSERCLGVASRNTALYQSAVSFLEKNVLGQPTFGSPHRLGSLPAEVLMEKDNGHVVVPILWPDGSVQYGVLTMKKKGGQWRIQDWELRQQHAGFRYSFNY